MRHYRVYTPRYELECELEEPHDARADQLIREELEQFSSAMLFEPVVKNGEYLGERDHVPGYWTDRRDLESESSGASSDADEVEKDEPFDLIGYQGSSSSGGSVLDMFTLILRSRVFWIFIAFLVFIGLLDMFYDSIIVPSGFAISRFNFQGLVLLAIVIACVALRRRRR